MEKGDSWSSSSIPRNWNFNSLPSILLRIALHSITSPSSCFKLWWNQWATAASWPSKRKQAGTGSLAATEEINSGCRGNYIRTQINCQRRPFLRPLMGKVKLNTAHRVAGTQSWCDEKCDSSASTWWTDYLSSHLPIFALVYKRVSNNRLFAWWACCVNPEHLVNRPSGTQGQKTAKYQDSSLFYT